VLLFSKLPREDKILVRDDQCFCGFALWKTLMWRGFSGGSLLWLLFRILWFGACWKAVTSHRSRRRTPTAPESIECPLCPGTGELSRAEILDRLGVKDFARVAQLSAEEAFRLLTQKHRHEEQSAWSRFEAELAKRNAEIREQHKDELRTLQSQRDDLTRRVEDCLREVAELRERNQELEAEFSKASRRGKLEEISFEEEARTWAGICVSEKLARGGDYLLSYRDPSGAPLEPRIVVDNKDKASVTEGDLKKLIRDVKERRCPVGIIVAREERQLRQHDRERRWGQEESIWILRTTRAWRDTAAEAVIQQGREVGMLARQLFPGGIEVRSDAGLDQAIRATRDTDGSRLGAGSPWRRRLPKWNPFRTEPQFRCDFDPGTGEWAASHAHRRYRGQSHHPELGTVRTCIEY
jgi:hypothetical protein